MTDNRKRAFPSGLDYPWAGMTLREYAMISAMHGILSNPNLVDNLTPAAIEYVRMGAAAVVKEMGIE